MKVIIPSMERSLPTSVSYRSDRISSLAFEVDVTGDEAKALSDEAVAGLRRRQVLDLDAQEAILRAKYDMPQPRPSPVTQPGGDFTTADKVPTTPPAPRMTPPPAAMAPVKDGTIDELRAIAGRLTAAGDSTEWPTPASEAEAQALVPKMRSRLYDITKPAMKPAAAVGPDFYGSPPPSKEPDALAKARGMTGAERRCLDAAHKPSQPRFLTIQEAAVSLTKTGRLLCPTHGGT